MKTPLPVIRVVSWDTPLPQTPTDDRRLQMEQFLQARSLSANSLRAYRRELERFLTWTDQAWSEITPRQVAQFKAELLAQGLKPTTVNRAIGVVLATEQKTTLSSETLLCMNSSH